MVLDYGTDVQNCKNVAHIIIYFHEPHLKRRSNLFAFLCELRYRRRGREGRQCEFEKRNTTRNLRSGRSHSSFWGFKADAYGSEVSIGGKGGYAAVDEVAASRTSM